MCIGVGVGVGVYVYMCVCVCIRVCIRVCLCVTDNSPPSRLAFLIVRVFSWCRPLSSLAELTSVVPGGRDAVGRQPFECPSLVLSLPAFARPQGVRLTPDTLQVTFTATSDIVRFGGGLTPLSPLPPIPPAHKARGGNVDDKERSIFTQENALHPPVVLLPANMLAARRQRKFFDPDNPNLEVPRPNGVAPPTPMTLTLTTEDGVTGDLAAANVSSATPGNHSRAGSSRASSSGTAIDHEIPCGVPTVAPDMLWGPPTREHAQLDRMSSQLYGTHHHGLTSEGRSLLDSSTESSSSSSFHSSTTSTARASPEVEATKSQRTSLLQSGVSVGLRMEVQLSSDHSFRHNVDSVLVPWVSRVLDVSVCPQLCMFPLESPLNPKIPFRLFFS